VALPSAPSGLCVLSTINALSLRVNWGTVDGASTYRVFRSEVPHDGFCQIAHGIPGLTYFDNPQAGKRLSINLRNVFYYKVASENLDGLGVLSEPSTYDQYGSIIDVNLPRTGLSHTGLV